MTASRPPDGGSAGITVVLLTPVVLALLAFAVLAGRVGTAHQDVVSAAQAAARAASLRDSGSSAAATDARAAAMTALDAAGVECRSTSVTVASAGPGPGEAATATVSCVVRLADLANLAMPGRMTVTASASAPIDVYRGDG
jgi:Flp pilus assembly protein TadG